MRYGYTPYKEKCECTWCEEIENEKDKLVSQNNDEDESIKLDVPFEGRQLYTKWRWSYPNPTKVKSKTFYIKYDKKLSAVEKILLNNFRKKYFYHAVDDILYSLKSKPIEQDNLLNMLYSPILSLKTDLRM